MLCDKIGKICVEYKMKKERALADLHSKVQQARREFMGASSTARQEFEKNIEFEKLPPQAKMDSRWCEISEILETAAKHRDDKIAMAGDDTYEIREAHFQYTMVLEYQDTRDDQGQDFEQIYMQSGIDPYYDPGYVEEEIAKDNNNNKVQQNIDEISNAINKNDSDYSDCTLHDPELFYSE
jgi:hypothetical protein